MFNPFDKPLKDVTYDDLDKLIRNNFCESLFVEYKSEMPDPKKIAKAIAGFANSYGGFLIIGADKNCGKEELPGSFPGATNMPRDPKEYVRNICRDHISTTPLYQSNYMSVNKTSGVLIIQIPESSNCPHINKDGRVYRRQSSGTDGESIAEDSRSAIDYLYAKGQSGEAAVNGYIRDRQDPRNVDRLDLGNRFSIEIIACPIPISDLIPDLFEDQETYLRLLPGYSYQFWVDIDRIYVEDSHRYQHIDTKGCVSMQQVMTPIDSNELQQSRRTPPAQYNGYPILQPDQISIFLRKPFLTMQKMLEVLSGKGIDYFGKIRIAVVMRKVNKKVLFYQDQTFYDDYEVRFCRRQTLSIPTFDIYAGDLVNTNDIIERMMTKVRRGFSLPF